MTDLGDGPGLVVRLGPEGVGLVLRREAPPMRAAPLRPADRILAEPPNDLPLLRREAPPNDLLLLRRELLRREAPPNDLPPLLRERSEEHTSELQSRFDLVCRLLLEKKKR